MPLHDDVAQLEHCIRGMRKVRSHALGLGARDQNDLSPLHDLSYWNKQRSEGLLATVEEAVKDVGSLALKASQHRYQNWRRKEEVKALGC